MVHAENASGHKTILVRWAKGVINNFNDIFQKNFANKRNYFCCY